MELPLVHPRMAFINGALDKEIRLSFAQRIRGTLPDPYQDLITEGKEKDTPDFKYSSDSRFFYPSPHVHSFLLLLQQLDFGSDSRQLANVFVQLLRMPTKAEKLCSWSARRLAMRRSSHL